MKNIFGIVITLGLHLVSMSTVKCAPQTTPALAKKIEVELSIKRDELYVDVVAGFDRVSSLLNQAISERKSELLIAALRVERAQLALTLSKSSNDHELITECLTPLIEDPSALLTEVDYALEYVDAIQLYCHALDEQRRSLDQHEELLRNALDQVDNSMGLSDSEKIIIQSQLRINGAFFADRVQNSIAVVSWLNPVIESKDVLLEGIRGARIFGEAVRKQSKNLATLGRVGDCVNLVHDSVITLNASSHLPLSDRMVIVSEILARQLNTFSRIPLEEHSPILMPDVENHMQKIDDYSGEALGDVFASGFRVHGMFIEFLGTSDFKSSMETVANVFAQFERYPELGTSKAVRGSAFDVWQRLANRFGKAYPVERPEIIRIGTQFVSKLESLGLDEDSAKALRERISEAGSR